MKYKLKEIGEIISGGTPSTKRSDFYATKGIGWITPKDLSNYHKKYICHGARDISKIGLDNSSAKIMPPNSILVSSRAPIGYVAMAEESLATNQGFKSIIPDVSKVLPDYLYYLMLNSKSKLEQVASGSTFKEVSGKTMANFEVDIPEIQKQKYIISLLNPIVKKIELNNQINDNLDALLTTIFEKQINNKSFKEANLTDIATYKNGLAMQKYRPKNNEKSLPVLKIRELNQGHTDDSSDRCSIKIDKNVIVNIGDIIFSWSGTLLVKNWSGKRAGLNQHLFKVTSNSYPDWFIYEWTKYYLRKFQSIAAGKATTMGHIKRSDLKSSKVRIPNESKLVELNTIMQPLYDKRIEVIEENQQLIELKQVLLQKFF